MLTTNNETSSGAPVQIGSHEIANLRELAARATKGTWYTDNRRVETVSFRTLCYTAHTDPDAQANADFIAAANPEMVLALLDALEVERAKVALLFPVALQLNQSIT